MIHFIDGVFHRAQIRPDACRLFLVTGHGQKFHRRPVQLQKVLIILRHITGPDIGPA